YSLSLHDALPIYVRMVRDQPQGRDLLLRELQVREGLGEVPVDGTVSQANVKTNDVADLADVLTTGDVRCSDGDPLFLSWHRPTRHEIVSIADAAEIGLAA